MLNWGHAKAEIERLKAELAEAREEIKRLPNGN